MITFDTNWVEILGVVLGTLLPLVVAIVTKVSTNASIKAILLAALALATNVLTGIENALATHTAFNVGTALILGLGTFAIAVASQFGLWAPTRVSHFLAVRLGAKDSDILAEIDEIRSHHNGKHEAP